MSSILDLASEVTEVPSGSNLAVLFESKGL